jgi:hypothetical protein
MDITDPYTAYCFNEVMSYIIVRLQNGDKPNWRINSTKNKIKEKHYKSFSDLYSKYEK